MISENISLSIVKPTEITQLTELYLQYLEEQLFNHISLGLNPNDYNGNYNNVQSDLLPILQSEHSKVIFAMTEQKEAIGFGISHIDLSSGCKYGNIDDIMVKKRHRNKGIGFLIYQELKKWFIDENCHSIILSTYWNSNAINFYRKIGFNPVGINLNLKL